MSDNQKLEAASASSSSLCLSNKSYTFNFNTSNADGQLGFSVTANENTVGGAFASILLRPNEAHCFSSFLCSVLKEKKPEGNFTIAARPNASLVAVMDTGGGGLSIYLNKKDMPSSPFLKLDKFSANLLHIKLSEHLCSIFDLPAAIVIKMLSSLSL